MRSCIILATAVLLVAGMALPVCAGHCLLDNPEDIIYDTLNDRYLIANAEAGTVVQMDSTGLITPFLDDLNIPLGLYIKDSLLLVAQVYSGRELAAYHLSTGDFLFGVPIPQEPWALSAVCEDTSGNLFGILFLL